MCGHHIRIWDAGCAMALNRIAWRYYCGKDVGVPFPQCEIHATDIDPSFASKVTLGTYRKEMKRSPDLFERYFRAVETRPLPRLSTRFGPGSSCRSRLAVAKTDPRRFHLIVCKNVLLHFDEQRRCDVLRMFHAAMHNDGLLAMEHTQKMPRRCGPCSTRWP